MPQNHWVVPFKDPDIYCFWAKILSICTPTRSEWKCEWLQFSICKLLKEIVCLWFLFKSFINKVHLENGSLIQGPRVLNWTTWAARTDKLPWVIPTPSSGVQSRLLFLEGDAPWWLVPSCGVAVVLWPYHSSLHLNTFLAGGGRESSSVSPGERQPLLLVTRASRQHARSHHSAWRFVVGIFE